MPTVSVIIPVFNSEKYIRETIESVFTQKYTDYEIILIDDGSTDRTEEVTKRYLEKKNFYYIKQPNRGPAAARNRGIKISRGQYCAFLDADDLMMPERLSLQAAALQENEQDGLVYSDLITFNDNGIVHYSKKQFIQPRSGLVLDKLLIENFITTSTVMVRKKCFDVVGYFDEAEKYRSVEDYKMWLRISERYQIKYLDNQLVKYRYHDDSISKDRVKNNLLALDVIKEFYKNNPEFRKANKRLYRQSNANHLVMIGRSYCDQSKFVHSMKYFIRALGFDITTTSVWLGILRTINRMARTYF